MSYGGGNTADPNAATCHVCGGRERPIMPSTVICRLAYDITDWLAISTSLPVLVASSTTSCTGACRVTHHIPCSLRHPYRNIMW
jgi:hypothetical protein